MPDENATTTAAEPTPVLNVQYALTAAEIPGFRGAFVSTNEHPEPPDTYCAYTCTRSPLNPYDDAASGVRVRAFLHLFTRGDPTAAAAALRNGMTGQGFCIIRETEGFDNAMGFYEILTEWEGADYASQL